MRVFPNRPTLSLKQQLIVYELKEKKRIGFETQSIYKDRSAFNNSMRILSKIDFVRRKHEITNGKVKNVFVLELQGVLYYGDVLSKLKNTMP